MGQPFCPEYWFCIPEFSKERERIEHKSWDLTHLMTNLRRVVCSRGTDKLSPKAWLAVAKSGRTALKRPMVEDLVDSQDIGFAQTTFSIEVQDVKKELSYTDEAAFCKLVRNWFRAGDEPGIPSTEHCHHRQQLRNYLLDGVDVGSFPPPGEYVKGFPKTLFEGIICSIDTHLQLYAMAPNSYNQRSISTLAAENFFSSLIELDTSGTGYLRAKDVPRCMGTASMIQAIRLDPNRSFHCKTARKTVYPTLEAEALIRARDDCDLNWQKPKRIEHIEIRDHHFDTSARKQNIEKKKNATLSKFGGPLRGAEPVRAFHRCNETKILPEKLI